MEQTSMKNQTTCENCNILKCYVAGCPDKENKPRKQRKHGKQTKKS
jgi:hypothetical protein